MCDRFDYGSSQHILPTGNRFQAPSENVNYLAMESEREKQTSREELGHQLKRGRVGLRGGIDDGCKGVAGL